MMHNPLSRGDLRSFFLVIGLTIAVIWGTASVLSIALGSGLLVLGMIGQLWSKGCLNRNSEVSRSGPYRFVRHPFYTANLLMDMGLVVMCGYWPSMVLAPIWWVMAYVPTMRREESYLLDRFPQAYRAYMAQVPQFIPWRRPAQPDGSRFTWLNPNLVRHEVARAVRHMVYPLLFILAMRADARGLDMLRSPKELDLFLAACVVALPAVGWLLRAHFRDRRQLVPDWALRPGPRLGLFVVIGLMGLLESGLDPVDAVWIHWLPGLALLGLCGIVFWRARTLALGGELVLAAALMLLFEVPMLLPLLLPVYLALALDARHPAPIQPLALPRLAYAAIAALGLILAVLFEISPPWLYLHLMS